MVRTRTKLENLSKEERLMSLLVLKTYQLSYPISPVVPMIF